MLFSADRSCDPQSIVARKQTSSLFHRQRELLVLLDALGGNVANLDFQKLLFLYCGEAWQPAPYEFIPYKYGAFSFTSYADRRKLIERGFLAEDEHGWRLTDAGRTEARIAGGHLNVAGFARKHSKLRGDALVAKTYRDFPYYATRSEIAHRVLGNDAAALARIDAARCVDRSAALCTIGYEGRTLENFLNELLRSGVTILCDVRRNPLSRKYGFAKQTLARGCEGVGVRYEHIPELGIASEQRRDLETQADYDALFDDYERKSLPTQRGPISRIRNWVKSGERVALTCYERLPTQCHRHCVAEAVERESKGVSTIHL